MTKKGWKFFPSRIFVCLSKTHSNYNAVTPPGSLNNWLCFMFVSYKFFHYFKRRNPKLSQPNENLCLVARCYDNALLPLFCLQKQNTSGENFALDRFLRILSFSFHLLLSDLNNCDKKNVIKFPDNFQSIEFLTSSFSSRSQAQKFRTREISIFIWIFIAHRVCTRERKKSIR